MTVLVLAPHTDDGEFGCGGTIAKLVEEGETIVYVAFSAAEKSVPHEFPPTILREEVKKATRILGILPENCIVYNCEVRTFPEHRQEILDQMIGLNSKFKPKMVFLPSPNDTHQDHQVVAREGFRAFKRTTMLGYEIPWNNLDFRSSCFFHLTEAQMNKKVAALNCYESQKGRNYASEEFIRSLAITRGTQIGGKFAETFEVIRWVVGF